jgi:hypothetical protein
MLAAIVLLDEGAELASKRLIPAERGLDGCGLSVAESVVQVCRQSFPRNHDPVLPLAA